MRGKTEDEIWAIVLDPFTGQDRIRLREFLDRITRDDVFDAELLRLWNATPADDWFSDGGLRIILKQARPAASAAEPPVLARARPVRSAQRLTGRRRRADGRSHAPRIRREGGAAVDAGGCRHRPPHRAGSVFADRAFRHRSRFARSPGRRRRPTLNVASDDGIFNRQLLFNPAVQPANRRVRQSIIQSLAFVGAYRRCRCNRTEPRRWR